MSEPTDQISKASLFARLKEERDRRVKAEEMLADLVPRLRLLVAEKKNRTLMPQDVLALVNYQFRSSLDALSNSISLLRNSPLTTEQAEWTHLAGAALRSLAYQVNQLRELGEFDSTKLELEDNQLCAADLLDEVVDLFETQARNERTALYATIDPKVAMRIRCDAGRMRQVLINILSIAMTHGRRGEVEMSAVKSGKSLAFKIIARPARDRGAVPADEADTAHVLGFELTGKLLKFMGGALELESKEPLVMSVTIPLKPAHQPHDRYIVGLRKALLELSPVVLVREGQQNWMTHALSRWGVKFRRMTPQRGMEKRIPQRSLVLVDDSELNRARALAKHSLRVVVTTTSLHHAQQRSDLESLRIGRRPLTERAWLESVAEPEPRRMRFDSVFSQTEHPSHILLAEDSMANRMIAVRLLEKLGHRVHAVADGREAVSAASQIEFDLILMDVKMPEMDGLEATRRILRSAQDGQAPPILALTGNDTEQNRKACKSSGMNDFLVKPMDPEMLSKAIEQWGRKGKSRRLQRTSASHMKLPLVDRGALIKLRKELDVSLIPEILSAFILEAEHKVGEAVKYAEEKKFSAVPKLLQPVRSSAASFGARQLESLISQVEAAIQSKQHDLASHYLAETAKVAKETNRLLTEHLAELAASQR